MNTDTDILFGRSSHLRNVSIAPMIELAEENDRLERRLKGLDEAGDAVAHFPPRNDFFYLVPMAIVDEVRECLSIVEVVAISREGISLRGQAFPLFSTDLINSQVPRHSV